VLAEGTGMPACGEGWRGGRGRASLQALLEGVLANLDLRSRFREHLAVAGWPELVGPVIAAHSRAEAVRDGVLIVAADTPTWAQELQMRTRELLERLARQFGEGLIRDIHFRSGTRPARGRRRGVVALRPKDIPLSSGQAQEIRAAAARIEDPQLRARAERAFAALARMAEWRRRGGWQRCARCGQWQRVGRRWCASCAHRSIRTKRRLTS